VICRKEAGLNRRGRSLEGSGSRDEVFKDGVVRGRWRWTCRSGGVGRGVSFCVVGVYNTEFRSMGNRLCVQLSERGLRGSGGVIFGGMTGHIWKRMRL
jgi:hypothetical protein